MIDRIKAFIKGAGEADDATNGIDRVQLAAAALLVEAAMMDGHFDDVERHAVIALLGERFDLDDDAARSLIEAGEAAVHESSQLYGFTRVVGQRFSHPERVQMIEMLWEVVYADGVLDDFEASLMRRISGLIHVTDRESGIARKRVRRRLGLAS